MRSARSNTRRTASWLCLALVSSTVALTGCPRRKFDIHMQLTDSDQVTRTLTSWEINGDVQSFDRETRDAAAEIYGPGERIMGDRDRFEGTFSQQLPADLVFNQWHNTGHVATSVSKMGKVVNYMERMPGPTQLEVVRKAKEIVDLYVKAMTAYMTNLPQVQQDASMRQAVEECFRREIRDDLLELALIYFRMSSLPEEMSEERLAIRSLGYLVETGAMTLEHWQSLRDQSMDSLLGMQATRLAAALGYAGDRAPPTWLADLFQAEGFSDALEMGLGMIHISKEEFEQKLSAIFLVGQTPLEGTLTWHADTKYVLTNGEWHPDATTIVWSDIGSVDQSMLPDILYASMSYPDFAYQRTYLSGTFIIHDLGAYNAWYNGLTPARQSEWESFVESLPAQPDRQHALYHFQFSGDVPAAVEEKKHEPVRGAVLIIAAMQGHDRENLPKVDYDRFQRE